MKDEKSSGVNAVKMERWMVSRAGEQERGEKERDGVGSSKVARGRSKQRAGDAANSHVGETPPRGSQDEFRRAQRGRQWSRPHHDLAGGLAEEEKTHQTECRPIKDGRKNKNEVRGREIWCWRWNANNSPSRTSLSSALQRGRVYIYIHTLSHTHMFINSYTDTHIHKDI